MNALKKRLAYLLATVLFVALFAPAAPSVTAFAAAKNPITELGIDKLPEGNTLNVGDVFNFNPKIIATKQGKGKTTGLVWWEVNAKAATAGVSSSRWGYVYPLYEGSFEIRALAFANKEDLKAWRAARSKNGNMADEAATQKYVTAKTDWVKISVVSDTQGYAVAHTQAQLERVLKNRKATDIHIKTDKDVQFTIARKFYQQRTLTVDAPNAEVVNAGRFTRINIQQIKASTFTENGYWNRFYVTAPNARMILQDAARVKEIVFAPEETAKDSQITVVGEGGSLDAFDVAAPGRVEFSGTIPGQAAGKALIVHIAEEAAGTTLRTDTALQVNAAADVAVTVDSAAGGETAQDAPKTVIQMEKAAKVSVDGTAANGTTIVVKGGAKGSAIASDAAVIVLADADVTLNLSEHAKGTTVTKGENVKVELDAASKVDGVSITDVNGIVGNIRPGEDSPEVTLAPSATPTPVPTTAPSGGSSGGSSGWTPSYPSATPIPTSTPVPTSTPTPTSGASYGLDGETVEVTFGAENKEAIIALPADSQQKTITLIVNGNSAQKALAVGVNEVSVSGYTVKFIVPVSVLGISANLTGVQVSGGTVTGSAILTVKGKDDLSAFTTDQDFTMSYEWKTGDTVIGDASGAVYQKEVEVAVDGGKVIYTEEGLYSLVVKVSHRSAGEVLVMKSGSLKIDFCMQEGEEPEITPSPVVTPTPETTPTPEGTPTPSVTPDDQPENDHVMDWKDPVLEAEMRKITGIYGRDIMLSDVYNLTIIQVVGQGMGSGISNIEALAELPHLKSLVLVNQNITDISALEGMAELSNIQLSRNKISNIEVLRTLPSLLNIYISDNNVSDISVLKEIENLMALDVSRNPVRLQDVLDVLSGRTGLRGIGVGGLGITDIKVLTDVVDLTGLSYLDLSGNQITDITALSGMVKMESLQLSGNQITDITALSGMVKMESLQLSGNQITDITALSELVNLKNLYLYNNQISDITALSGLVKLESLQLSDNPIMDITALSGLVKLESLYLQNNQISDITPLSGMTNMKYLGLDLNQISDITALSALVNLKNLQFYGNQISDIAPLSRMLELENLNLSGNQIMDITMLSKLVNLKDINLAANKITDVTALSELVNLKNLYLYNNQITNITALSGLGNLEYLYLSGNQIKDITALSELKNLVNLDLSYNQITDIEALSGLQNLKELALSGNEITDYTPVEFVPELNK